MASPRTAEQPLLDQVRILLIEDEPVCAEIVTAFHVMRIAVVSSTVLLVFKLYMMLKGGRVGPSL